MKWLLILVVVPVLLVFWRLFEDYYKRRERKELIEAIRVTVQEELITMRNVSSTKLDRCQNRKARMSVRACLYNCNLLANPARAFRV
jgi:hypothetical protein